MNAAKQRRAMCLEYEAKGFTVTENASSGILGLSLPFTLDIVAVDAAGAVIIDIASRDRSEDEAMQRFHMIRDAIHQRPEIEFEVRFYDIAAEIDKFGKDLEKLRDTNPDNPAYGEIIDLMLKRGIVFGKHRQ